MGFSGALLGLIDLVLFSEMSRLLECSPLYFHKAYLAYETRYRFRILVNAVNDCKNVEGISISKH